MIDALLRAPPGGSYDRLRAPNLCWKNCTMRDYTDESDLTNPQHEVDQPPL